MCVFLQAVLDANVFPQVVRYLAEGEYLHKKEAVWIVSNAVHGGTKEQIRYTLLRYFAVCCSGFCFALLFAFVCYTLITNHLVCIVAKRLSPTILCFCDE